MDKRIVDKAIEYIQDVFKNRSDGHDAEHSIRVYKNAKAIAAHYEDCDMKLVSLAALLHDVDDHKLFQTEDNANARRFLAGQNVDKETADRICRIVESVSFSKNKDRRPETIEAKIVQDADRLDAIGAIGIARTFAYGGEHGRSMESSIQHFYEKLLLLKDELNTEAARKMAEERHEYMESFLEEYEKETSFAVKE